jgi:hypothetical protein
VKHERRLGVPLLVIEQVVLRAHVDAPAPLQRREEHRGDAAADPASDVVQRPPAAVPVPGRRRLASARSAGGAAAERDVPPRGRNGLRREGWHPCRQAKVNVAMAMAMAWSGRKQKGQPARHF